MSETNTAGTVPLVGGNKDLGCTVLESHEGRSAFQDTLEQINGEGTITFLVPFLALVKLYLSPSCNE